MSEPATRRLDRFPGNDGDLTEVGSIGTVRSGVDVQSIRRFRDLDADVRRAIRERVFTESERRYCESTGDPDQHYAARWAAKEAFRKAIDGPIAFGDVAVERSDAGSRLSLSDHASARLGETLGTDEWVADVSLSHDRTADAAIAQLVVVGGTDE